MKFLKTTVSICLCLGFFGCETETLTEEVIENGGKTKVVEIIPEEVGEIGNVVETPIEIPSFENPEIVSASGASAESILDSVKNLFSQKKPKPSVTQPKPLVVQKIEIKKYELPKILPTEKGCEGKKDIMEQISCYGDRATMEKNYEMCDTLEVDGAKFQCYSFYAERAEDEAICKKISIWTHSALKDTCIKNVAIAKGDGKVCRKISATGKNTKDSCYLKLSQITLDLALCEKIDNEEVYFECSGKKKSESVPTPIVIPEVEKVDETPIIEPIIEIEPEMPTPPEEDSEIIPEEEGTPATESVPQK